MTVIDFLNMIQAMLIIAKISAVVFVISLILYIVEIIRERKDRRKK